MSYTIYTATGCTRCKIVKQFMRERGIDYVEQDMKAAGKEAFQKFYIANRKSIFRGPAGVEFPILTDGSTIRQGIGASIAFLRANHQLDGFFSVGILHKEWVDGIHISSGNPEYAVEFLEVLRYLKGNNMKLQLDTNGLNSQLLQQILDEGLADVVIMNVVGPRELYSGILGQDVDITEVEKTISLVSRFPEYKFQTMVVPVIRQEGDQPEVRYLTAQEIGETAKFIQEVTGSMKNPYYIKLWQPKEASDPRVKTMEPMTPAGLLSYRNPARVHQVFAEIEKAST
ncbi:hypothetical protein [Desulforamulus aeronauticus]|uniref:Pyruvate formate lyase activating enzyme n=1 Tax=Desulforamulus aeronauticus DSM 10349 TaxID=1121421 RepID=A0A1M6SI40_9FIRM|nr:hypothetical protein [Desulforamulus aeronauticus]SHK44299.1 pyruvate formate lyase activating enzyme [Desulforamulus aeronauticus DSM 10349]